MKKEQTSSWHRGEMKMSGLFLLALHIPPDVRELLFICQPSLIWSLTKQSTFFALTHSLTPRMCHLYVFVELLSVCPNTHVSLFSVLPRAALRKNHADWSLWLRKWCDVWCKPLGYLLLVNAFSFCSSIITFVVRNQFNIEIDWRDFYHCTYVWVRGFWLILMNVYIWNFWASMLILNYCTR